MTDLLNIPIAVCYAAGAGGNFVAGALNSALFDRPFNIDSQGDCKENVIFRAAHLVPSNNIEGQCQELNTIKNLKFPDNNNWIFAGHIRNLVALQEHRNDLWFIKISHNVNDIDECLQLYKLLSNKVNIKFALEHVYNQVKGADWPETFAEFHSSPASDKFFRDTHMYTLKNWFWVENHSTRIRTIELTIDDIFKGRISEKLCQWFDLSVTQKLDNFQEEYQNKNKQYFGT